MARLTRAELQVRNRAKVVLAARAEFAERGFTDATIDSIAERADLTRGAVYSNFPGKRALYFAALADLAIRPTALPVPPGRSTAEALESFAKAWLAKVGSGLSGEVLADEDTRTQYGQLMKLGALLLGLSLEQLGFADQEGQRRMVGVAELALTTLRGAVELTGAAPGFVQPLHVSKACGQFAALDLNDRWKRPPSAPPVRPADEVWDPPAMTDAIRARPAELFEDGLIVVLGLNRLTAAEDAVRAVAAAELELDRLARTRLGTADTTVTVALVSDQPAELGALARLVVAETVGCLKQAFLEPDWPTLQLVHDETGALATAAGVEQLGNDLEYAVRVANGRIFARAEGFGAAATIAAATTPTAVRTF